MNPSVTIIDEYEMKAILRALIEAKFHPEPNDEPIQASPYVAALCDRLVEAIAAVERERFGAERGERFLAFYASPPPPPQLEVARKIIGKCPPDVWAGWSEAERRELVRLVLSPFQGTPELFEELLRAGPAS